MNEIILKITDESKADFLYKLLSELDFVEIKSEPLPIKKDKDSFLGSAGIWQNRDIKAEDLRKQAWRI